MWKIKLSLISGLSHELNDVRSNSPGWAECQPPSIEKLTFSFQGKDPKSGLNHSYELILAGMERYNFFVEASRSILGGKTKIQGLWFLGKIPNTNKITGFVLKESVIQINAIDGKEYSGVATVGWKQGVSNGKAFSNVIRR